MWPSALKTTTVAPCRPCPGLSQSPRPGPACGSGLPDSPLGPQCGTGSPVPSSLAASAQAPRGAAPSRADAAQTASRPRSPAASLRGRPRVALGIARSLEGMTAPGSAGASAPVSRPRRGARPRAESPPAQRGAKPLRRGGLCPTPHGGTHRALGCGTRAHTATGITQLCTHLCAHTHAQGHTRPALRKPVSG